MIRFVLARLGVLIPTFIGVTIVAFALIRATIGLRVSPVRERRGVDLEDDDLVVASARQEVSDDELSELLD